MTVLLPSAARRTRFLFAWDAARCLEAPEQSLAAVTGQAATFSRASTKTALDANGVSRIVPHSLPAFQWATDPTSGLSVPGVLLEGSGVNLALQSEDWSTTWAAVGTPTRVAASDVASGVSLDTIGDDAAGTLEGYSQTVTFTGNAVKAISVHVKQGTSTSSVIRLRDTTAGADRLLAAITWTGSVPTVTMTTGTYLGAVAGYGGVYRLLFATTSVTAANTNSLQFYPATTAALAIANTGTILAGGVQAENAITPSSYTKTTTGTVTRAADSLVFPVNIPPIALTMYADLVQLGGVPGATTQIVAALGSSANIPPQLYIGLINGTVNSVLDTFTTDSSASLGVIITANGQHVEALAAITSPVTGGVVTTSASIDSGAITSATSGATATPFPAWNGQWLIIGNLGAGVIPGQFSLQRFRIAAGVQSISTMRGTGGVVNTNPIVP